jgi:hypothetical protein
MQQVQEILQIHSFRKSLPLSQIQSKKSLIQQKIN